MIKTFTMVLIAIMVATTAAAEVTTETEVAGVFEGVGFVKIDEDFGAARARAYDRAEVNAVLNALYAIMSNDRTDLTDAIAVRVEAEIRGDNYSKYIKDVTLVSEVTERNRLRVVVRVEVNVTALRRFATGEVTGD